MSMDPTATSGGKLVDRVRDLSQGVAMAGGCRINDHVRCGLQGWERRGEEGNKSGQDRGVGRAWWLVVIVVVAGGWWLVEVKENK